MAGDPEQLEAVARSQTASDCGLKQSYMGRLIKKPCYAANANKKYDERFTIQLTKNYRSHWAILKMPNELYYNNSLEYCASPELVNRMIGCDFLRKKTFPVLFDTMKGKSETLPNDTSPFNTLEAVAVVKWVKKLLDGTWNGTKLSQADIGIVTPYRQQVKTIQKLLVKSEYEDITVGSAEVFQGQERTIIIISTVRIAETKKDLGFVAEDKVS